MYETQHYNNIIIRRRFVSFAVQDTTATAIDRHGQFAGAKIDQQRTRIYE